jgi:protein-S-isoprenylcysteine O-methyltransferase Ste14
MVFSVIVIAGSFVSFDIWEFFGIRQTQKKEKGQVIQKHGFYGIVRHPMYLGAFVYFTASMTHAPLPQFLGYLILAIYVIIGTFREDRRLLRELGDVYREYQKEVPMILPGIARRKT